MAEPGPVAPSPRPGFSRFLFLLALAALAAILAATAFYDLFSSFRTYDDEGLLLLFSQLLQEGYVPYRELSWNYGPAYLALVQLLHEVLGIPVSHAAVRGLTLLYWLVIALLCGLLLRQLTASRLWALSGAVLVFLYIGSLVNEPGHPQGWIAIFTLLALILPGLASDGEGRWHWLLVGCAVAAIVHIKINAGLFVLAAVSIVLLAPWAGQRRIFRACLVLGCLCGPFVLMARHLADPDCLLFAALSALACAGVTVQLTCHHPGNERVFGKLACFAAGGIGLSLLMTGYLYVLGSSPLDFIGSLAGYAGSQSMFYHHFSDFSPLQLLAALLAFCCALGLGSRRQAGWGGQLLPLMKGAFALAGLVFVLIDNPARAHYLAAWLAPWSWLVLLNADAGRPTLQRALLAAVAVWSPLLAYPIAGTQLYLGSFFILLAAVVCASDCLAGQGEAGSGLRPVFGRTIPALYLAIALGALGLQLQQVYTRFQAFSPLELPGTGPLRVQARLARQYASLAAEIRPGDTLVTSSRFYSMYLWTGARFPGPAAWSLFYLALMPAEQQAELGELVSGADAPVLLVPGLRGAGNRRRPDLEGLPVWVGRDFRPVGGNSRFVILRRRAEPVPPAGQMDH